MAAPTTNSTYMTPGIAPRASGLERDMKPTLLAFHGSGSNATVHTVQLARLMRVIKGHFEVESLEGKYTEPPTTSFHQHHITTFGSWTSNSSDD
jgi:hypothetical protein